ncbi:MAG: glycosyl transferase [Candidatus Lokiarchaeota archaeon]|nr:glycosyl transferase [Candidatus Lokiarchaeota archaeon]
MQYGYFDDEKKEYIITKPDTPLPWINYLGCNDFYSIISNTAGGYCFYKDARYRRITRYRYNNVPFDFGGRYIYIRDNDRKEYWSPTWQPIQNKLDKYECRHGLGYSIISSEYKKIETIINYFIPLNNNLEIWHLEIKNNNESEVNLSIFSSIEFCLWDALDDASNFQRNFNTGEVEIEKNVIYHKTEYRERRNHFTYFACSDELEGYDTQREDFIGPYRSWSKPIVVETGKSKNSHAHGWSPIGSHHIKFNLKSGESKDIIFLLGYFENKVEEKFDPPQSQIINKKLVKLLIEKFLKKENINSAFEDLKNYWAKLLGKYQVSCPDIHINRMVNIWNPYQNMITFNVSRAASFYESGISRGIGFRDSNQDLLGFIHLVPDRARERIIDLASTQLENGGAYHQYQPLTKKGNDSIGSNFNDDPLWLVLSVATYLKETGDWSILEEMVPYENKSGTEQPLLDHLKRSIIYTQNNLGPHGLPLIGRADWNDCLNLNCFSKEPNESFQTTTNTEGNIAESIFIAGLFTLAAKEFAGILEKMSRNKDSKKYFEMANKMESIICSHGWDGEWFLRAYDSYGNKIGSNECDEGKIFIEPQGFCVMAGVGIENGLAEKALNSVRNLLATDHGIVLLQPPYSKYYLHLGEISSYPPGYKENGSIFCHTNPWIMIAETLIGRGEEALDYYLKINPSAREKISDLHKCEPYIYAQTIAGKDASLHGEAKNSWLTGTAAWNYVAITNWILGIRPTFDGLLVSPIVPKSWSNFKITRVYRDVIYNINIERIGKGNKSAIYINNEELDGNIIPLPKSGEKEVTVNVKLS